MIDEERFDGTCPTCGQEWITNKLASTQLALQREHAEVERLRARLAELGEEPSPEAAGGLSGDVIRGDIVEVDNG